MLEEGCEKSNPHQCVCYMYSFFFKWSPGSHTWARRLLRKRVRDLNIVYNIPLALSFNIELSYKVEFWVPIRIENAAKCNKCTKSSCRIVVLFNLLNC